MTQEEKELLLKDLYARLPYKTLYAVKNINYGFLGKHYIENIYVDSIGNRAFSLSAPYSVQGIENVKPYLRPMSSMTEEEKHKLLKFGAITCLENGEVIDVSCVGFERHADVQDYLNTCHFDYRGLIPMGLALVAPEDMYKTE